MGVLIYLAIGMIFGFIVGFFVGGHNAKKAEALRKQLEEQAKKAKEKL